MRRSFHDEWTDVQNFLRSCYVFSDKVVKLNESRGEFEVDEVQEYLQGLAPQLVQLLVTTCGILLSQHIEITKAFNQSAVQLLLHPTAARNSPDHAVHQTFIEDYRLRTPTDPQPFHPFPHHSQRLRMASVPSTGY